MTMPTVEVGFSGRGVVIPSKQNGNGTHATAAQPEAFAKIEPKQVQVSRARVEELIEAGKTPDEAKQIAVDEATNPDAALGQWSNIPMELRALRQWVCWKLEPDDKGRLTKIPYQTNGRKAASNNERTWNTFEACVRAAPKFSGIGIMFADELVGIDLDDCIENGALNKHARHITETLKTYTEISPSGTGLHLLCWGKLPDGWRKQDTIEMYGEGSPKYFTVTGKRLENTPPTIERRFDEVAALHKEFAPAPKTETPAPTTPTANTTNTGQVQDAYARAENVSVHNAPRAGTLSDNEIIALASNGKNGAKFMRLYSGDTSDYGNDHSAADCGLCSELAYWCGQNGHAQLDRIFRTSGLMRPKWDEKHGAATYGATTIAKAIQGKTRFFDAPQATNTGANTGQAAANANSGTPAKFAHPYLIQNGGICLKKQTNNGEVIVPLCNFTAEITAEVAHDDGAEVTRLLTIEGKHADGYTLPGARVDASQFASFKWLAPSFGTRAIIVAGQSAQDHLRAAIQHLSTNVQAQHVYTHTGWREINGQRVFLTSTGASGHTSASVELEKELRTYALPPQPSDAAEAMRASMRFLQIAPLRVTLPLWSSMFLAPLAPLVPIKFVLWLYGVTGTMKTTLAALAMNHYGDFAEDDLTMWNSTSNALEKFLFLAKDVPFVIDDFAPQSDPTSARRLENTVSNIVRDAGNKAGRARMKSDLSLRTVYRPRGLVISTGEQLPDGQSLMARLLTVELTRGEVEIAKLSAAQDERELYSHAMAGYVQWLAGSWDALQNSVADAWKVTRARARKEGQHLRLPENIAALFVGFDRALQYAVSTGAISADDAETLLQNGWQALTETGARQDQLTEEERPTRRFLSVLGELIVQGAARLTTLTTLTTPNAGGGGTDFLGWCDQESLYLLPGESYRRVSEFARQQGRHFGIKETALRKALAEENLIETEPPHMTARLTIGGSTRRVLKVRRAEFEKIAGQVSP